ncbi:MAG: ABC transporter ATP-binding protein [Chromatiaceae bacterium]|jgi:ABC-2 type transport system ATP-binding protein|nr:ABC transporter ATP-binding protein [Chromatiaceae bacterium]
MIQVQQLTRRYGELRAVDEVSFAIGRGEVVGLLGHNGAGKTTIMKMLTGYLEPDSGTIEIAGLDLAAHRRAVQGRIGYLPENCPLYPEMTVIDFLEHQAALHGLPPAAQGAAVLSAIERTALGARAVDPIGNLSRGYRQRVGVAQAILHRPAILILDEPTNGLDPSQIQHMRTLIRELAQESTVILSTHILQEVEAVCDRVLIMRAGRLALDAHLGALSAPQRLLLTLDPGPQAVRPLLAGIDGVEQVLALDPEDGRQRFALVAADPITAAPLVADAVHRAGWALYALHPEIRDLETLFGEVNEAEAPSHA